MFPRDIRGTSTCTNPTFLPQASSLLWETGYKHFTERLEIPDLLQCSGSEFPRAQLAWTVAAAGDSAFKLHFAMLSEQLKQKGYCIMTSVVTDGLPQSPSSSKSFLHCTPMKTGSSPW